MTSELRNIVESLIFASEEEITSKQIKDIADSFNIKSSIKEIDEIVDDLNDEYRGFNKSFEIIKIAGGYTFATRKDYALYVGKLFTERQKKKLSQSSIETLAIVAYKQPITRSEIEFIRGVNVDYIVNSLLERDLVTIIGRADAPGRPILYGTTKNFIKALGLNSIEDLPKLKEINEILRTEKIEGITEADIDLFNSYNNPEVSNEKLQLEFNANGNDTGDQIEDAEKSEEIEENIEAESRDENHDDNVSNRDNL